MSLTRRDPAVEDHVHSGHTKPGECVLESLIACVSRGLGASDCEMSFGHLLNPDRDPCAIKQTLRLVSV
jgi:hypothetical protein